MVNYITPMTVTLFIVAVILIFEAVTILPKYLKPESFDKNMIIKASNFNTNNVKYKNNVYIIMGNNYNVLDNKIILNGITRSLRNNMIILGEKAPGFMRQILNISYESNKTIFNTKKVDIDKVLEEANFEKTFTYEEISSNNSNEVKEKFSYENTFPTSFRKNVEKTFYFNRNQEVEGGDTTKYSGTTGINGTIDFKPSIYIKLNMKGSTVFKFILKLNADFESIINTFFLSRHSISRTFSKKLFPSNRLQERSSTWYISIYTGIWISLKPSVTGEIDLSSEGRVDIQNIIETGTKKPYSIGVEYTKTINPGIFGRNTSNIDYLSQNAEWYRRIRNVSNPTADINVEILGKLVFNIDCLLWGFVGPYFNVSPYSKFQTEVSLESCLPPLVDDLCPVFLSNAGLGISLNIGGRLFDNELNRQIYNNYWNLWNDRSNVNYLNNRLP